MNPPIASCTDAFCHCYRGVIQLRNIENAIKERSMRNNSNVEIKSWEKRSISLGHVCRNKSSSSMWKVSAGVVSSLISPTLSYKRGIRESQWKSNLIHLWYTVEPNIVDCTRLFKCHHRRWYAVNLILLVVRNILFTSTASTSAPCLLSSCWQPHCNSNCGIDCCR